MSHLEEYTHSTHPPALRDEIFRSWSRYVSRVRKRSYEFNCYELYREGPPSRLTLCPRLKQKAAVRNRLYVQIM